MKKAILLIVLLVLSSCAKVDEDDITLDLFIYKASCNIENTIPEVTACALYRTAFTGDTEIDCYNLNLSLGGDSYNHYPAEMQALCGEDDLAGICKLSDKWVYFYTTQYTTGQAQTECTSMGGSLD